jgi:hypothetical protein
MILFADRSESLLEKSLERCVRLRTPRRGKEKEGDEQFQSIMGFRCSTFRQSIDELLLLDEPDRYRVARVSGELGS